MKLHQKEHCHNCNNWVDYEFDDVPSRQIIICPVCYHQHYREIDETTLTTIRLNIRAQDCMGGEVRIAQGQKVIKVTDRRWGQDPSQRHG